MVLAIGDRRLVRFTFGVSIAVIVGLAGVSLGIESLARELPSEQLQRALEVPTEGDAALKLIAEFAALHQNRTSPPDARERAIAIAEAALHGMPPDALTRDTLRGVTVASDSFYGSEIVAGARTKMYSILVREVQKPSDPQRARTLAQGLLVLMAQDRVLGLPSLAGEVDSSSPALQTAALPDKVARVVQSIAGASGQSQEQTLGALRQTSKMLEGLIAAPNDDARWNDLKRGFCDPLEAGISAAGQRVDLHWSLLANAWRVACLAKANQRQAALDELDATLKRVRAATTDPIVMTWIDQVLTVPGPPPKRPAARFLDDPSQLKRGKPD